MFFRIALKGGETSHVDGREIRGKTTNGGLLLFFRFAVYGLSDQAINSRVIVFSVDKEVATARV